MSDHPTRQEWDTLPSRTTWAHYDAERAKVESIRDQHRRILSWEPADVHAAYAVLMQFAASWARAGKNGKPAADAIDTIQRAVSQAKAAEDAERAKRERAEAEVELLRGLLGEASATIRGCAALLADPGSSAEAELDAKADRIDAALAREEDHA